MKHLAKKLAYLTIDDAPTEGFMKIIDFLESFDIKALVFCVGNQLKKYMQQAQYAIQHGHIIGNHSYDHLDFSTIHVDEARYQIEKTDTLINTIYTETGVVRPMKVFRFPYLNNGNQDDNGVCLWEDPHVDAIQQILKDFGYRQPLFEQIRYPWFAKSGLDTCLNVDCTYDTFDWCIEKGKELFGYHDLPTILARMDENEPDSGRGLNTLDSNEIIMTHAWIPYEAFTAIIQKLLEKPIHFALPPW